MYRGRLLILERDGDRDLLLERVRKTGDTNGVALCTFVVLVSSNRSPCAVGVYLSDTAQMLMVGIDWLEVGSTPSSTLSGMPQGMDGVQSARCGPRVILSHPSLTSIQILSSNSFSRYG